MKKFFLLLVTQMVVATMFAQQNPVPGIPKHEPINPVKDQQEFKGYIIRLIPALPTPQSVGSYGFDILLNNKPVLHLFENPMPFAPRGIQKKDDAFKIARWMIQQHDKTGYWENIIPPHVADELKIAIN